MINMKLRKNLTISEDVWAILETLKRVQGRSISAIIENSVKKYVKLEKINPLYLKMMTDPNVKHMTKKENDEITAILDNMTEEDMKPVTELEL